MRFAHDQQRRGTVTTPATVGALLQLGRCFDLLDTRYTEELPLAFAEWKGLLDGRGWPLPVNAGATPDLLRRHRDCAVLNYFFRRLEEHRGFYDTVRCAFSEGPPVFEGSGIHQRSHVQIAVRSPACIIGVFRPTLSS